MWSVVLCLGCHRPHEEHTWLQHAGGRSQHVAPTVEQQAYPSTSLPFCWSCEFPAVLCWSQDEAGWVVQGPQLLCTRAVTAQIQCTAAYHGLQLCVNRRRNRTHTHSMKSSYLRHSF